jgi:membrane fusion protein, multidrug efflux system
MTSADDRPRRRPAVVVAIGTALIVGLGAFVIARQRSHAQKLALVSLPKAVTVAVARAASYRPDRRYVGTIEPWVEAKIGPQVIAAYADTVLVRPGDRVVRGQVVATLDCRNASASSKAVSMQARAIQAEQEALAHEAARVAQLQSGGFASPNEIERHSAESASKAAELMETEARLKRATLEVSDCLLRAPFTGEIATRLVDPGAFVHPGTAVATIVDRTSVRVVAEVPETDYDAVAPGTPVRIRAVATGRAIEAPIARRSPAADASTRTVDVEIDLPDPDRSLPVGTTAELGIDVGRPEPATELPLTAASIRGARATVFVVDGELAHRRIVAVKGERAGLVYVDPALAAGSRVVTEGRALLEDGDRVTARVDPLTAPEPAHAELTGAR